MVTFISLRKLIKKPLQLSFKIWWFSTFTTFSLHSWSSVAADFCISSAYVTSGTKGSFCFQNIPVSGGLNRKNTSKNMKFWPLNPYYKRSNWKNLTSRKILWSLTSKLWNKKIHTAEAYWNGAKLNYWILPVFLPFLT